MTGELPPVLQELAYRNLIFDIPERMLQMRDLGNVLFNLTKLQMTLLIDISVVCLPSGNILGPIARTLSTAKNLLCLNLEAIGAVRDEEDSLGNFGVVLSGCIFGNLISLKLEGFKCTVTELLRFTDGCSELEEFTLSTFQLARGTWADAINHRKANLKRLTLVDLIRLAGSLGPDRESWSLEFEDCWVASLDEECLLNLKGSIEDFLVGNGSNPFSLAELRR